MSENGKEEQTFRQKIHEPILNPIQITILLLIVVFNVITAILPILMGIPINPIWVVSILIIGIVSYAVLSLLSAAYPEEVPDTRITTAFKIFIKQIIDAMLQNRDEQSDLQALLERIIVWAIREWDALYQMDLKDAIEYAKSKLKKETVLENLE